MIQKRCGVFETNSSSSHSITFEGINSKKKCFLNCLNSSANLKIMSDGYIYSDLDIFTYRCGNACRLTKASDKLSYLLTFVATFEGRNCRYDSDFYKLEGYKKINNCVKNYYNMAIKNNQIVEDVHGVLLTSKSFSRNGCFGIFNGYVDPSAYYLLGRGLNNLTQLLHLYGVTLKQAIFDPLVVILVESD